MIHQIPLRYFNPRSREGATGQNLTRCHLELYFNPRSREGATYKALGGNGTGEISILAPAKERPETVMESKLITYFNPRSREGATLPDDC